MRYIEPDELPAPTGAALARLLHDQGRSSPAWTVRHVWTSGPAFAVCLQRGFEVRAFTVGPRDGGELVAFDVTGR